MRCTAPLTQCHSVACWVHNCGPMKGAQKVKKLDKKPKIEASNKAEIEARTKAGEISPSLASLLLVIADVFDLAASGQDIYMTLGMTRDKSGYLMTIFWNGERVYASGGSLMSLAEEASLLL